MGSVTAVIVWYDEPVEVVRAAVDSLLAQSQPPREILIFDNSPRASVERLGAEDIVRAIGNRSNRGYFAGITRAVALSSCDYVLVLNPDARADPACLELLVRTADADPHTAIAGAQILLDDGVTCNAGDNPLHPSGISVSGRYREPREYGEPREVAVTSGACWLIRRSAFSALGGLTDELFLYYHDDVDLAWRARIAGLEVVYCPQATARHSYEFSRRPQKWFLLERNRLFSVLANYELRTLLLLAPLLVATEVGVLVIAAIDGWLPGKLRAYASLAGLHRRLRERRRPVRGIRRRSDAELLPLFSDRLDSPLLSAPGAAVANFFCVPYLRIVRLLAR